MHEHDNRFLPGVQAVIMVSEDDALENKASLKAPPVALGALLICDWALSRPTCVPCAWPPR